MPIFSVGYFLYAVISTGSIGWGGGLQLDHTDLRGEMMRLERSIDRLDGKIDRIYDRLDGRIDKMYDRLDGKIDLMSDRLSQLNREVSFLQGLNGAPRGRS